MDHQTLYFTDGSDVIVTNSNFQVKNVNYPLDAIFSHRVSMVMPHKAPPTILTISGAVVFLCGAFDFLPPKNELISLFGMSIVANALVMVLGTVVMLWGMFLLFHLRDKYIVKLSTSSGEKNALVSDKLEYVNQIREALNHAHLDLMKKPTMKTWGR